MILYISLALLLFILGLYGMYKGGKSAIWDIIFCEVTLLSITMIYLLGSIYLDGCLVADLYVFGILVIAGIESVVIVVIITFKYYTIQDLVDKITDIINRF